MIEYAEIVKKWADNIHTIDIFSGQLLYTLSTDTSRLEGINISYNQTKELFANEYVRQYTGDLRDLYSIVNNRELASFYNHELSKHTRVTPWFIKKSHRILMRASMDNHRYHDNGERAGEYKIHDYGVGRLNTGSTPEEVPDDIVALCDLIYSDMEAPVIARASILHCVFEGIHPFADGNGRVGRWLMNYFLVSENHPPIVLIEDNKEDYYSALEDYDKTGKVTKFMEFLKKQVEYGYEVYRL